MKTNKKFIVIAGPCVIESKSLTLDIAGFLKEVLQGYPVKFFFKASFDKANRTSLTSFRGPGLAKGINILEEVKKKFDLPILSDVHSSAQIQQVKDVLDIIQIPAFLCRQTDIIIAAAKANKAVNVKKGQFISPLDVAHILKKIESAGNKNILITERGSCFGYNNLIVDFRSFLIMKKFGYPVIFDATHSLQRPSARAGVSGGDREFVLPMSLASVACGVDGLFLEVHPNPKKALSDRYTSYPLNKLGSLIKKAIDLKAAVKEG